MQRQMLALERVGFLFSAYRPGCYYWEITELVRKFLLTSVVNLISPGSAEQVIAGCVFSLASVLLAVQAQPYSSGTLNHANLIALVALFLFFFVGLLLKVDADGKTQTSGAPVYSACLSVLCIMPAALPIGIPFFAMFHSKLSQIFGGDSDLSTYDIFETLYANS